MEKYQISNKLFGRFDIPMDGLHQPSKHTLHPSLRNVLQELPANPLPHHVFVRAGRKMRSHVRHDGVCMEKRAHINL